jgi:hypothetical protein
MKKYFILFIVLFVFSSMSYSQNKTDVKASLNNLFRYGSGSENNTSTEYAKEYFENITDARLKINDFAFGLRYEISDPIEYGLNFKGIKKRYLEYNNVKEGIDIRAGDFYNIVGRGTSLNVFEDRGLFYDTGIDGVKVAYTKSFGIKNPMKIKAQVFGGDINFNDFLVPSRSETYRIRDGNFEFTPVKYLTIGANYIYATGNITALDLISQSGITAELPEGYISFNYKNLQLFSSYTHKHVTVAPNPVSQSAVGDGFYSSLSYSKSSIGVTLEYKNYRFDVVSPDQSNNSTRPTKMLPFQNPPTVVKEHSSTLISRNPHVVDFNDEVGMQLDIIYAPTDKLTFNLNGSVASKHYEYQNIGTYPKVVYGRIDRSSSFLPSLNDAFNPFWEVYFESEYYATKKLYAKIAFSRQNSVIYNQQFPLFSEKLFITTIPTEFKYSLSPGYTLKLVAEQQWEHNSISSGITDFMNQFFSLTLSKSPELSATISTEFTNGTDDPSGKKNWISGEVAYKLTPSNTITASYGDERGGFRCTSGICRYVYPFNGFRLMINSKF